MAHPTVSNSILHLFVSVAFYFVFSFLVLCYLFLIAFGQSSGSSPFASQSLFGQTSNSSSNNPFAPATQFGSSTPFAAQTGSSIFGSTSTGVFGAPQASSPFASTPTFGASSSPAFGNSTPAFGASPASSPFGG